MTEIKASNILIKKWIYVDRDIKTNEIKKFMILDAQSNIDEDRTGFYGEVSFWEDEDENLSKFFLELFKNSSKLSKVELLKLVKNVL
jgi:hypothetical protein